MKKILLLLALGAISGSVGAEIYKCVENDRLTVSDAPCPPGATSTVAPSAPQTPRSRSSTEELETLKQKLEVLQHERQEREAVHEAEQKRQDEIEALQKLQKEIEAKKKEEVDQKALRNAIIRKRKAKKLEDERGWQGG